MKNSNDWHVYYSGDSCDRIWFPWTTKAGAEALVEALKIADPERSYYAKREEVKKQPRRAAA